jgi:hypothetical protein
MKAEISSSLKRLNNCVNEEEALKMTNGFFNISDLKLKEGETL